MNIFCVRLRLANIAGMRKFTQYSSRTNMRPRTLKRIGLTWKRMQCRIRHGSRILREFFLFTRPPAYTWGMFLEAVSQAGERASSATDDAGAAATGEAGAAGAPLVPHVS